jgi:signal transduction histidine kinase
VTYVGRQLRLAGRDLVYLTIGLLTSIVAFVVWITGATTVACLAVFIVGIPAFVVAARVFRWSADLDRANAARILGERPRAVYGPRSTSLLARVRDTAADPQTWRDFAWLVIHSIVGFGFGVAAVSVVVSVVGYALLPAWYWAIPDGVDVGVWNVDTAGEAFAVVPFALLMMPVTVALLRLMAIAESRLAGALLGPAGDHARLRAQLGDSTALLRTHATADAIIGFSCTLIWGLTGRDYFWPIWVWLGLLLCLGLHAAYVVGNRQGWLRAHAVADGVVGSICTVIWAVTGAGYFWPGWVWAGLLVALGLHWAVLHRLTPRHRERQLRKRVDELSRTRRGALDVQAEELRRIERDLHDGAQARLVSLSMLIGRAEDQLADRPEAAELLRQAREESTAAIGELRDLARGIAPPVLADRGLVAAVEAQATRAPMDVTVQADDVERLAPVVETAAYFVVSEALTNVAKHAGGAPARVALRRDGDALRIEIADDGPGGADANGSGLTGLRRRVEALDGSLAVDSDGTGTRIRAELPCG